MCEQYVAISATPFRLDSLWPMTERLEHFGIAGFGWGATWLRPDGALQSHRDLGTFRDDRRRHDLGAIETRAVLVHLRRPSKFSTIGLPDTQPFDDPAGRYAFSHNGELQHDRAYRTRYREAGRVLGKADTEVSARWLEDHWSEASSVPDALAALHHVFGGHANLAVLTSDGRGHHYAGNRENPVFSFDIGDIRLACTGMYSLDRSVFKFVAPEASNRRLVPSEQTASI
jgi:predicted glutamine amidotransferase